MKNEYEIRGDVTAIFLRRKDGTILEALIDTADLPLVDSFPARWCSQWSPTARRFYVVGMYPRNGTEKKSRVPLHRWIMTPESHLVVDHINHDGLDNRRAKLRNVSHSVNLMNRSQPPRLSPRNTSGFVGVSWVKSQRKWVATIGMNGKNYRIGSYDSKEDARDAYEQRLRSRFPDLDRTHRREMLTD